MKNRLITLNLAIIIAIFSTLAIGVESFAIETPAPTVQNSLPTAQSAPKTSDSQTIPERNAYVLNHIGQQGSQNPLVKFFLAMLGVLISSGAIFLGLRFYKKLMLKNNTKLDSIDYNKTLDSPKDFKEAINLFLDKTDKE